MFQTATEHPQVHAGAPLREVPTLPWVARDRLVARLAASTSRAVLLSAPAGYGKTTLLEDWAREDPRPFRWVAPPPAAARSRSRWRTALAAAAAPGRAPEPQVLVVDDWPLDGDLGDQRRLRDLIAGLGPGSQVAVATRGAGAVHVGRLRAQRDVLELGRADLALTDAEAATVLARAGVRLHGAALQTLLRKTAGWPAMLSLAAQVLAADPDPGRAALRFGGDDPFVAEYVTDEVLQGLPARLSRFLRRCSVLEVLDAELCDAVLDEQVSAALLHRLAGSEVPATCLDRAAERVRCHPLVREVLQAELRRREPALARTAHARAGHLLAQRGDLDAAVAHAVAAGDLPRAGALLWSEAAWQPWAGRSLTLDRLLRRLPAHAAEEHASVAMTAAMEALTRFALVDVEQHLRAAGEVLGRAPAEVRPALEAGHRTLSAALESDVAGLHAAARTAELPAGPHRSLARFLEGTGRLLEGADSEAVPLLEDGVRGALPAAPGLAALCEAQLGLAGLCGADHQAGTLHAVRGRSRLGPGGVGAVPALALVPAAAALARAHGGSFAEAREDVQLALRLLVAGDEPPAWYAAEVHLALGRALLRLSDAGGARTHLAHARRLLERLPEAAGLRAWVDGGDRAADAYLAAGSATGDPLTPAELRVLHFLPSHLAFREIGAGLQLSPNTIKSQARAVYRKLGVTSRSAAVRRAAQLGLLDEVAAGGLGAGDETPVADDRPA